MCPEVSRDAITEPAGRRAGADANVIGRPAGRGIMEMEIGVHEVVLLESGDGTNVMVLLRGGCAHRASAAPCVA
jgi:hypothetical protein